MAARASNSTGARVQRAVVTRPVGRVAGVPVRIVDVIIVAAGLSGSAAITLSSEMAATSRIDLRVASLDKGRVLLVGFVLLGVAAFWGLLLRWRHERLEGENRVLEQGLAESREREQHAWTLTEALMRAELALILKENDLWSDERVSFFIDDPDGQGLVLAARSSPRLTFNSQPPHAPYPYRQGCLGRAWDNGRAFYVTDLPDPKDHLDEWQAALSADWDLPCEVSAGMTMRSRTVYAERFEGGVGKNALGVVVIESTRGVTSAVGDVKQLTRISLERYFTTKKEMIARLFELVAELRAALELPAHDQPPASRRWFVLRRARSARR